MKGTLSNKGFTLLEILIAMAIFTLIGIASTAVLTSVIDSDEMSSHRFEKLQELQRAMITLERDILQAVPRPVRLEGESNSIVISGGNSLFRSDGDGLGFTRVGWQNPQLMLPRSTLQAIAYRLQEGQLQRLYGNYVDNVIGHEPKVKAILSNVEDFQVEFIATADKDPMESDSWDETYVGEALPIAVAIEITTLDFGLIRREFLLTQPIQTSKNNNSNNNNNNNSGGNS